MVRLPIEVPDLPPKLPLELLKLPPKVVEARYKPPLEVLEVPFEGVSHPLDAPQLRQAPPMRQARAPCNQYPLGHQPPYLP